MHTPIRYLDLRCPDCRWRQTCGPGEIAGWLVKIRKLRPNRDLPELEILYELFHAGAGQFTCPRCGRTGLGVANALDDEHSWPGKPTCAACGKAIEPERVEAVHGARLCAACQRQKESGRPVEEKDFCPRCGSPLEVRVIQEGQRTRYVLACSAKPPCLLR